MLKYLVLLGALVSLLGVISYVKGTIKGDTKPNRVTWLMWSIAPLIATFAAFSTGVTWAVLPVFMSGLGPLLVFISSFINKNAYWKLEKFDYLCGFFSLLALILWFITKQPMIAIIFAIISDFFAAIPTLIKSVKHPETESVAPYTTGLFSAVTSFFAVKIWLFPEYGFSSYLVLINIVLIISVYWQKIKTRFRK